MHRKKKGKDSSPGVQDREVVMETEHTYIISIVFKDGRSKLLKHSISLRATLNSSTLVDLGEW